MSAQREAIEEFWRWWPGVAAAFDAAFAQKQGVPPAMITALSERVAAIDDRLDWEFGPGERSRHHLCLSSKGDPELRVIVERWLRRAPTSDDAWEFYAARRANPHGGLQLDIAGHAIALDEMQLALTLDAGRARVDLRVDHPVFAAIDDEDLRMRIAFIALDNTLGEDDVERWIGAIELGIPAGSSPLALPALLPALRALVRGCEGARWSLLEGTIDGAPTVVLLDTAIKRIDHLTMDMHLAIEIALREPTDAGLPTRAEAATLDAMEDALVERLGSHAVHIARETSRGVRALHFHTMEAGPSAAIVAAWKEQHSAHTIRVEARRDPRWDVLRRWL